MFFSRVLFGREFGGSVAPVRFATSGRRTSPPVSKYSPLVGDRSCHRFMNDVLRVDHAGEYGALRIYAGQLDALGKGEHESVLKLMRDQELGHLCTFNRLLVERRVRPSALMPIWHVSGYVLGYVTGMMGLRAAMTCTQAVEEVIADHYNEQLREVLGREPKDVELRKVLKSFRDDEQEHHDTAVDHRSKETFGHYWLYNGIKAGTKLAIYVASKI